MRVRVIVNRGGGAVRAEGGPAIEAELARAFARRGVDASVVLCGGSDIGREARAALDEADRGRRPFDAVVVGGGDGTVGAVAGALAGTGTTLGVLPLGTLNHFAKDLGLPADLDGAVDVIAAGRVRRVDVAEVSGQVFVNNSSIGLYAEMVADRDRERRAAGRAKWLATLLAGWRALRRFPLRRLSVRAEGWALPCETPLVFVGNNAYEVSLPNAGGRAVLDRGELCLYVVRHCGRWGLLRLAARAALGRLDQERDFELRSVTEAEIRSWARWPLRVAADGEVAALRPPLRYRTRPGALRVLAPEAPAAATPRSSVSPPRSGNP
jgi:diacylglycerol kinase family enzyme